MTVDQHSEESYNDSDDEHSLIIRMKWCADGSRTMDEVIEKLKEQIAYIERLKQNGYELTQPMNDDYGFLKRQNLDCQEVLSEVS